MNSDSRISTTVVKTLTLLAIAATLAFASFSSTSSALAQQTTATTAPRGDGGRPSFTANGYTSTYLLYTEGLNHSKPIGLLVYADGSGEFGLKHPSSKYLLSGKNGLINVAKKHNMVLLTPLSPNKNCSDGDGSCWYLGNPPGYAKWAESLVKMIEAKYQINKTRVAFGGYSSGAQLATEWWVPSGAAQRTMDDGVIVAISYGGSPKMKEVAYTPAFKQNVHMSWNVGSKDPFSWLGNGDGRFGVKAGYNAYTKEGFNTTLTVVPGVTHNRGGSFGSIMDVEITKYVPPAS